MGKTTPDYFRSKGLDQLYSIDGYRRHVDVEDKYEYLFPENWLFDRSILLADAREQEMPKILRDKLRLKQSVRPDSAYAPPPDIDIININNNRNNKDKKENTRNNGNENISVIKSNVLPGFSLKNTLGEPKEAAERLLQNMLASNVNVNSDKNSNSRNIENNSNKKYELINAYAENRNNVPAYIFEYTVQKDDMVSPEGSLVKKGFYTHSISVILSRGTELFTFTCIVPENKWIDEKTNIDMVSKSFQITAPLIPTGFY